MHLGFSSLRVWDLGFLLFGDLGFRVLGLGVSQMFEAQGWRLKVWGWGLNYHGFAYDPLMQHLLRSPFLRHTWDS